MAGDRRWERGVAYTIDKRIRLIVWRVDFAFEGVRDAEHYPVYGDAEAFFETNRILRAVGAADPAAITPSRVYLGLPVRDAEGYRAELTQTHALSTPAALLWIDLSNIFRPEHYGRFIASQVQFQL